MWLVIERKPLCPATPPPDYDLDLALGSIERIRGAARTGGLVLFAHYGPVAEVDRICDLAGARFRAWTETVSEAMERGADLEAIVELLRGESVRDVETGAAASLDLGRLEGLG